MMGLLGWFCQRLNDYDLMTIYVYELLSLTHDVFILLEYSIP